MEFEHTMLPIREEHRGYFRRELVKHCYQIYNFANVRIENVRRLF